MTYMYCSAAICKTQTFSYYTVALSDQITTITVRLRAIFTLFLYICGCTEKENSVLKCQQNYFSTQIRIQQQPQKPTI